MKNILITLLLLTVPLFSDMKHIQCKYNNGEKLILNIQKDTETIRFISMQGNIGGEHFKYVGSHKYGQYNVTADRYLSNKGYLITVYDNFMSEARWKDLRLEKTIHFYDCKNYRFPR